MMRYCHFRVSVCVLLLTLVFVASVNALSCDYYTQRVQCGDLACSKKTNQCIPCTTNDDCYPGAMVCNRATGKCKVHSVFKNFDVVTAFAFIFAFIVCAVGVIAGVGGGGILVPLFTPMLQFPMVSAVALSQSTICGQATLNVFLSMRQKHPDLTWDRPLINYQYLSILLPLGLIGTLIGSILNNICPDFIRLILLFILLTAVLIRTIKRTRSQFSKDNKST